MSSSNFVQRTICPACGGKEFTQVFVTDYDDPTMNKYLHKYYDYQGGVEFEYLKGAKYSLQDCNNCRLVFQEFIPNDDLMFRLYEKWIDPEFTLKNRVNKDGIDYYKRFSAEIINLLAYFKTNPYDTKFLDFGMGWGKWSLMAKAFGVDSYGMELSLERIEYAKKHGIKVISWDEVPDNRFDFINTEQVFEHIPEPLETMRHLSQALKPEGIIKISVPNGNDIRRRLTIMDWDAKRKGRNSLMVVTPLEHINCYQTKSIITMGEKCGLENVKIPFTFIGFRSFKDFIKIAFRKPYYKYRKTGDIVLYFKKKNSA